MLAQCLNSTLVKPGELKGNPLLIIVLKPLQLRRPGSQIAQPPNANHADFPRL